jgi:glucose-1-phosphate cytidylyltransferase
MYKVIILAGGLGTRLSEETGLKPKPMVEIGGVPIINHIMKIFHMQIGAEFLIATGYKHEVIENYLLSDNFVAQGMQAKSIFTGNETGTAGRIKKILKLYPNESMFITYGDGLANINLHKLIKYHEHHKKMATVTAVRPAARYGRIHINAGKVEHFAEKLQTDEGWINGGFFLVEPEIESFLNHDEEMFEQKPLVEITKRGELMAYEHYGFWQPMDTLREKNDLEKLAMSRNIPWFNFNS